MDFPGGSDDKESACNAGDLSLIPVLGRFPWGGHATHSNILAWRILMDRGAWWATVHGVAKSQSQLSDETQNSINTWYTDSWYTWRHWLGGHELEQAPGVGDGQGSLVCYSPWGRKESDTTEQLNWIDWYGLSFLQHNFFLPLSHPNML